MPEVTDIIENVQEEMKKLVAELKDGFCYLKTTLEDLEKRLNNSMFRVQDQQIDQRREIERNSNLVAHALKDVHMLEHKVETLEVQKINLQHKMDVAHTRLMGHERVLEKFIQGFGSIELQAEIDRDPDLYNYKQGHTDDQKASSK